jgi:hypothetical protein
MRTNEFGIRNIKDILMPNPNKYKDKKNFMEDCMHQTLHMERRGPNQSKAICLNKWRDKKEITSHLDEIANEIQAQDPVLALAIDRISDKLAGKSRDWGKMVNESKKLYDEFHVALKTNDPQKILDAQLKLFDIYNVPRVELLSQIKEVYPDKITEILRGKSL